MKSKYELTISNNYVPDWTYIEAFRELFQNALDNEITNPENKMEFNYNSEEGIISITNKTSILEIDTLLLGHTTKANDKNTIGRHGEGYKVAFMVLLREGKKIKVYNYGNREIWTVRLVKSRKYNGQLITTVDVEKEAFWKNVPDNDLTIEVTGVTQEEYNSIKEKNLHLRESVERFEVPYSGSILTGKEEKCNIYVKGLFVCKSEGLEYGYDFEPSVIELDRDRKLLRQIDITWETSVMWKFAFAKGFRKEEILDMIERASIDVEYFSNRNDIQNKINAEESECDYEDSTDVEADIAEKLAEKFIEENGTESMPVSNNSELELATTNGLKAIMVNSNTAKYIKASGMLESNLEKYSIKESLQSLLDDIEYRLTTVEIDRFKEIIDRINE